jgi:uncharacterized protein (DUF1015 family)
MVDILPFKAIHYNFTKFPNLSLVSCPPYDIISVPQYHQLLARHPNNFVRVELPMGSGKVDRYEEAARYWRRWQNQRILVADKEPAFYGYEQRFMVNLQPTFRRGFFAALKLEPPGKGHVRAHERTFPKHKEDRLRLMRATQANSSPVFGIFFDPQEKIHTLLAARMREKPLAVGRDDKGVTNRLWRWTDPVLIKKLSQALRGQEVLIADGHHRYETAWNFAVEQSAHRRSAAPRAAYRYVLMFLCPLSDPGLVIQPTHRAVRWDGTFQRWLRRIESDFTIQRVSSLNTLLARLRSTRAPAVGMAMEGGKLFWLKPKPGRGVLSALPVVALHERLLRDVSPDHIQYNQDPHEMVQAIQRQEANVAFLLTAPDKDAFARICKSGHLLPQKSTYFYPKIAAGFVMRSTQGIL